MKNLGINDGCKMEVKDIEMTETFKCTGQELYNALTQKEMIQVFTGGEVKVRIKLTDHFFLFRFSKLFKFHLFLSLLISIFNLQMKEAKKGEAFEMIGGNVQGSFIDLVPFTKIVQKWRLKSWPDGYFAHVEITIKQTNEDTKLNLKVKQVPEKEIENTKMGWKRYYFESIKRVFGFGSSLF